MPDIPNFSDLWDKFNSGRVGGVLKSNPMMEELCKVIFAAAVTEVVKVSAQVPRDLNSIFMLKLVSTAAEAGTKSVDRLLDLMRRTGDGNVSVDLHGVFVPGEFKV